MNKTIEKFKEFSKAVDVAVENKVLEKDKKFSIDLENFSLEDQKEIIDYVLDNGSFHLSIKFPDKSTEKIYVSTVINWDKFGMYTGGFYLPPKRKPREIRKSGLVKLFEMSFSKIFTSKPSVILDSKNKTLVAYVMIEVEKKIKNIPVYINPNWDNRNKPLQPVTNEEYNSWEKLRPFLDPEKILNSLLVDKLPEE